VITDDIKEGCSIIEKQLLKVKFGSSLPEKIKTTIFLFRIRGENQRDFLEKPF
jgi:hypothetical protein